MPQADMDKFRAETRVAASDGRHELFKSTQVFDGPHHQVQHGFELQKPAG